MGNQMTNEYTPAEWAEIEGPFNYLCEPGDPLFEDERCPDCDGLLVVHPLDEGPMWAQCQNCGAEFEESIQVDLEWEIEMMTYNFEDVRYRAALEVVQCLDGQLRRGLHYRNQQGRLLLTLDEVVSAILRDELVLAGSQNGGE